MDSSGATTPIKRARGNSTDQSKPVSSIVFSAKEVKALEGANRVLVVQYSSTGGGHTARCLDPVQKAIDNKVFGGDDCVVILAPPRWESDRDGGKVNKLHELAAKMGGMTNVIIKQADKTVTGLYKSSGDSDNVRMLLDFVNKPKRNMQAIALSNARIDSKEPAFTKGSASSAQTLLTAVIDAVGKGSQHKISILTDMAPDLQKAAAAAGISKRLEIGNHQGLFIGSARDQLEGKDLAYLHKASGSGHADKLHLVEYGAEVNVVPGLAPLMKTLGIKEDMSQSEARNIVIGHLLEHAVKIDRIADHERVPNGVLMGSDVKKSSDVRAMVYLYVNDYTRDVAKHILDKMSDKASSYGNALVALCGAGAIRESESSKGATDILKCMYAANADGVTNAGFGTTSEFYYMSKHGYAGSFVAFPVVNQHEQEANAAAMVSGLADVTSAHSPKEVCAAIDGLVSKRHDNPIAHLKGSMASLFEASNSTTSGPENAARLLASLYDANDVNESHNAGEAKKAMDSYGAGEAKLHRRVYKLAVPALEAIANGDTMCAIRATSKHDETRMGVAEVAKMLTELGAGNSGQAFQNLMGLNSPEAPQLSNKTRLLAKELGEQMTSLLNNHTDRQDAANAALEDLAVKKVALGW